MQMKEGRKNARAAKYGKHADDKMTSALRGTGTMRPCVLSG